MTKEKMTAKEKLHHKTVKMVEKLVTDGMAITKAREAAAFKMGVSIPTIWRWTEHLNVRAKKSTDK